MYHCTKVLAKNIIFLIGIFNDLGLDVTTTYNVHLTKRKYTIQCSFVSDIDVTIKHIRYELFWAEN